MGHGPDLQREEGATRTLKQLGAEMLVLTNAAGSLRPDAGPGSLVCISDHINLLGFNPLVGPNDDAAGPRFPSLRDAYDPELRGRLHAAADALGTELHDGVYLAVSGPSFETPAEIRAFRTLGADLVGMSTVPEVIAARHTGLRCAAISAVTAVRREARSSPTGSSRNTAPSRRSAPAQPTSSLWSCSGSLEKNAGSSAFSLIWHFQR